MFTDYTEYLLGENVFKLCATGPLEKKVSDPPFEVVVSYDFNVRKHLATLINEGQQFKEALRAA